MNKRIIIAGIFGTVLLVGLAAGLILVKNQQDIRSKAAGCVQKWPADPNSECGKSTQSPKQGEANVSLTPNFHWDYGGGVTCTRSSGCSSYHANVYLWKGNCPTGKGACGDSNLIASCSLGARGDSPYQDASFNCFKKWKDGPLLQTLEPNTTYTWRPAPGGDNIVHAEQDWNYTFTTKTSSQTVGCNQTCSTNNDCDATKGLTCDSTSGKCRNAACSTETDCVCKNTVKCNETCDATRLCPTGLTCTEVPNSPGQIGFTMKCRKPACSTDSTCVCTVPVAACQKVEMSKTFDQVKVGDPVVFTGYGTLGVGDSTDSIDKINFRVFKGEVVDKDQTVNATLDTTKSTSTLQVYRATYDYTISAAATYRVVIKVHKVKGDVWLE